MSREESGEMNLQESVAAEERHTIVDVGVDVPPEPKQCQQQPESPEAHEFVEQSQTECPTENIKLSDPINESPVEEMEVDGPITDKTEETINETATESQATSETLDCAEIEDVTIEDERNKEIDQGKYPFIFIYRNECLNTLQNR